MSFLRLKWRAIFGSLCDHDVFNDLVNEIKTIWKTKQEIRDARLYSTQNSM